MNIKKIRLEADEEVLLQVRKHWFILALQIFVLVIVSTFPYLLYVAISSNAQTAEMFASNVPAGMSVSLYSAWLLIIWMTFFNIWNNYYLDVWTITNKRLIAVDQRGFFFRTTASFRLDRLQDIEISVNGLLATFLDYGSIEMQTAGEQRNFKATGLPGPGYIKATILRSTDIISRQGPPSSDGV